MSLAAFDRNLKEWHKQDVSLFPCLGADGRSSRCDNLAVLGSLGPGSSCLSVWSFEHCPHPHGYHTSAATLCFRYQEKQRNKRPSYGHFLEVPHIISLHGLLARIQ